jgi:hypothetical protein
MGILYTLLIGSDNVHDVVIDSWLCGHMAGFACASIVNVHYVLV